MKKFFKHDKARAVFGLSKSILSSEHDDDSDDDDNNSKCREVNGRSKKFLLGEREQSSRLSTFQCWGGGACLSRGEEVMMMMMMMKRRRRRRRKRRKGLNTMAAGAEESGARE